MPGRHAALKPASKPRWPRRLSITLLVLAVLVGGAFVGRDYLPDFQNALNRFVTDSCEGEVPVQILASPDIAPVVESILADEDLPGPADVAGSCVEVSVTQLASAEAAAAIGGSARADLWIPDSTMWLERVTAADVEFAEPVSVAVSPLVGVASRPLADQLGWPDVDFSWQAVLGGDLPGAIIDPTETSTGLATLLTAATALGEQVEQAQLVGAMTALHQNQVSGVTEAFELVDAAPDSAPVFAAVEQAVVAHNQAGGSPAVALYPAEGTFVFDYPAIAITTSATSAETRTAAGHVLDVLGSDEAIQALQRQGFRAPDGATGALAGVGDGIDPRMPSALPIPPAEMARAIVSQWAALSIDMRMLAVIDVSGSMDAADDGETTRAQFVAEAATSALGLLPETSEVGLWVFSTFEDEPNDRHHRQLVPIGPMNEELEGGTRVELLAGAAGEIPSIVAVNAPEPLKGWTALYATTKAAFDTMKSSYDPGKINSIVLMTDGEDEWPEGHASPLAREDLIAQLEAHDPDRQIPIIAIGIGEAADEDALKAIAEATGGSWHIALDPADIRDVFVTAMIERQCRPMC